MCTQYGAWYTCGHKRGVETLNAIDTEPIPVCTERPAECRLCDLIAQIFEGFPEQKDPGCEVAQKAQNETTRQKDLKNRL